MWRDVMWLSDMRFLVCSDPNSLGLLLRRWCHLVSYIQHTHARTMYHAEDEVKEEDTSRPPPLDASTAKRALVTLALWTILKISLMTVVRDSNV
jgi:hypothetical protein